MEDDFIFIGSYKNNKRYYQAAQLFENNGLFVERVAENNYMRVKAKYTNTIFYYYPIKKKWRKANTNKFNDVRSDEYFLQSVLLREFKNEKLTNIMKILIEKHEDTYRADFSELCGSPLIGIGSTKEEAVANLFISNISKLGRLNLNEVKITYDE